MGLGYHYTFSAPAKVPMAELSEFLEDIRAEAQALGLEATATLARELDSPEWRKMARLFVPGLRVEDERLKGVIPVDEQRVWDFSPGAGHCRVAAERIVILGLCYEGRAEFVFGFAWHPTALRDIHGREWIALPEGGQWFWRHCVETPDPRFRQLVKRFAQAGYLVEERDEFKPA